MYGKIQQYLQDELQTIEDNGIFKKERIITSPQGAEITISTGEKVLNFCANNYLGLSSHPEVVQAAKDALDTHGFGMSSVRFICGTQDIHKTLEKKIADFYGVSTDYLLGRESKEQTALDELVGQFNMDLLEKKIVENYFALPKKMRGDLMTFLEKSVKEVTEESKNIYLKASRSIDDRGPEIVTLTPEQKKRLDEAPDETQNPDNDI